MVFSPIQNDPGPPPDRGSRAWLQVLAGCLINALTWGYSASFGVYQLYYTERLHFPPSQASWIGSVQVFMTFFVGVFSGRSSDAGMTQQTVLLGCCMCVFGTFMTSLSESYWQIFLSQGLCTGLGMGVMYMPTVAIISSYFQKNKALALTISASGNGVGSIMFPLVVQHLQDKIGFAWAVRVQGFIALGFSIVVMVLLRPRLPPRKSGPIMELSAFREPPYSFFAVGMFFIFWALFFGFFYINSFATSVLGVSGETAANLLVIINAVGIPTRPLVGLVSDRLLGPLPTLILSSIFLSIMLFVWIPVKSIGGMYAWVVLYGIATTGTQGICVGALVSLTKDPARMGTRFGMALSLFGFATLAGPPTGGGIIETMNNNYVGAQAWAGAVTITGSLFIAIAWWSDRKAMAGNT